MTDADTPVVGQVSADPVGSTPDPFVSTSVVDAGNGVVTPPIPPETQTSQDADTPHDTQVNPVDMPLPPGLTPIPVGHDESTTTVPEVMPPLVEVPVPEVPLPPVPEVIPQVDVPVPPAPVPPVVTPVADTPDTPVPPAPVPPVVTPIIDTPVPPAPVSPLVTPSVTEPVIPAPVPPTPVPTTEPETTTFPSTIPIEPVPQVPVETPVANKQEGIFARIKKLLGSH